MKRTLLFLLFILTLSPKYVLAYGLNEDLNDATFTINTGGGIFIPDINGDGYSEIISGENIYFGRENWPNSLTQPSVTISGLGYAYYAGDVNADGYGDLISFSSSNIYLILGRKTWNSTYNINDIKQATFVAPTSPNHVGYIGDINGDGYDDMGIGIPTHYIWEDPPPYYIRSYVFIVFGSASPSSVPSLLTGADASILGSSVNALTDSASADWFGNALRYAGDINADGYDDFIVSSYEDPAGGNDLGRTYLFYGKTSGWILNAAKTDADASFIGIVSNTRIGTFGSSHFRSDFNYDGYDDIYYGGTGNQTNISYGGSTYLFFGPDPGWGLDQSTNNADAYYLGTRLEERVGYPVVTADLNLDGMSDLLTAGGRYNYGNVREGITWLVYGKTSGWSPAVNITSADASWPGLNSGDLARIASADDINGDGIDDLIFESRAGVGYIILNEVGSTESPAYKLRISSGDKPAKKMPEANITIDFSTVTSSSGYITVTEHLNQKPVDAANFGTLKKYWTIEPTDLSDYTYNITFKYSDYDLDGMENEEHLKIFYKSGSDWIEVPSQADPDTNRIWTTGGVTHFSDWIVGKEQDYPTSVEIKSEYDYSTAQNPRITFTKSTDTTGTLPSTGLSHYNVYLDRGTSSELSIENIPVQGNGDDNYAWVDNRDVKVIFLNEDVGNSSDDRIRVEFKSYNDERIKEGKHEWLVEAVDGAGNTTTTTASIYIDLTNPILDDLAISPLFASDWGGNRIENGQRYFLSSQFNFFGFSALARDPFSSQTIYHPNDITHTFPQISSGPEKINLLIEKKNTSGAYENYLEEEYRFGSGQALGNDIATIIDQSKESRLYFDSPVGMVNGEYRITIKLVDKVDNWTSKMFYVNIGSPTFTSVKAVRPEQLDQLSEVKTNYPEPSLAEEEPLPPTEQIPLSSPSILSSIIQFIKNFFTR